MKYLPQFESSKNFQHSIGDIVSVNYEIYPERHRSGIIIDIKHSTFGWLYQVIFPNWGRGKVWILESEIIDNISKS